MNRSFYTFANFFLGLAVTAGIFQSIIHFLLGPQMYFLQPFAHWLLGVSIISLISLLFLLKYFHYKKYWLTFWSGTVSTILIFCLSILVYIILILATRELETYNILIILLNLGVGVIFALSLIFSNAGERPNLKTAGIFMFITNLVLGFAFIWSLSSRDIQTYSTFEKINQWASLVSSLIPILFIRNFRTEIKTLKTKNVTTALPKSLENILDFVAVIALIFTLVFGIWLALESYWKLNWINRGPEKVQQLAKAFETRIFVNNQGDTMHYLLMKPLDYDPQKKYPLVVCLHGGPGPVKKNQVRKVEVPQPAPLLSNRINREKYPAFIFVPQAPPGHSWGGVPYVPDVDTLVFETIHSLEEEFEIDEKRRYVAGASGGGYGSWHFIGVRPEMFAAAIPVCGAGNPELAKNMVDTPIWAFHGRNDRNVPVNASREMIEAIKNAGGNPLYTEFPGVGHNTWPHVIKTPGLLDWLFAQKRD